MQQPASYTGGDGNVWKLKRSLYCLKQAPRCWAQRFGDCLKEIGLTNPTPDPCNFYRSQPFVIMAVYVDDTVILSTTKEKALDLIRSLRKEFEVNVIFDRPYIIQRP